MSSSRADGIAPINGPKNGIILVIPILVLMSTGNSILKIVIRIKQIIPMIKESRIFPVIKPLRDLFIFETILPISADIFSGKSAIFIFLH